MKKKTISSVFDTIFWGFLLVLPLIMLIIVNVQFKYFFQRSEESYGSSDSLEVTEQYYPAPRLYEYGIAYEVYSRLGLGGYTDYAGNDFWSWSYSTENPVYKLFQRFLANTDPLLGPFNLSLDYSNFWSFYFAWFVFIELMHITVDLILFIPRACKKLLGRWSYE